MKKYMQRGRDKGNAGEFYGDVMKARNVAAAAATKPPPPLNRRARRAATRLKKQK